MPDRRVVLRAAAAAATILGAGLAWRAWDQGVFSTGEGPAYDPWRTWKDGNAGSAERLVRAAILAANPHNSQPWRFRVQSASIDLFADRARNIGRIDPVLREMHIGLGCALENLLIAASAEGFEYRLTLFPNPSDITHVARVELAPGGKLDLGSPLYGAIPRRHTNRGAYHTDRPLEPSVFGEMQALGQDLPLVSVRWFVSADSRRSIGELVVQATEVIISDREQSRDSAAWFRPTWQEIQQKRDGLTIDAQALPAWMRAAAKVLPPVSQGQSEQIWLKSTREVQVATAAAFGVLLARDAADNANRMQSGRFWQRMHLWAETRGIAMQPLNQIPERADRERTLGIEPRFGNAIKELAGDPAWQVVMPFRLGYPTISALASPRRSVEQVVVA
jgi:hypothetical protein